MKKVDELGRLLALAEKKFGMDSPSAKALRELIANEYEANSGQQPQTTRMFGAFVNGPPRIKAELSPLTALLLDNMQAYRQSTRERPLRSQVEGSATWIHRNWVDPEEVDERIAELSLQSAQKERQRQRPGLALVPAFNYLPATHRQAYLEYIRNEAIQKKDWPTLRIILDFQQMTEEGVYPEETTTKRGDVAS